MIGIFFQALLEIKIGASFTTYYDLGTTNVCVQCTNYIYFLFLNVMKHFLSRVSRDTNLTREKVKNNNLGYYTSFRTV